MAKSRRSMRWFLAGLAAATALWMNWPAATTRVDATPPRGFATGDATASVPALNAASGPASAAVLLTAPAASARQDDALSWRQLYATADLFPQLLRLHQARRTGSYAAVRALNQACIEATLWTFYADGDPLARSDVNHPDHAKRLAARELIKARCGHMTAGGGLLLDVGAGDSEGQRFMQAYLKLQIPRGKSGTELSEALAEVARQGHPEVMLKLYEATQIAQGWRAWISPETTNDALRATKIAELRFTAPAGVQAEQDVRLAFRCFMDGNCSYRYDDLSDISDPRQRERILAMAAELEAALRTPDPVQALFKKR